jgi:hypothetical protein
MHGRTGNYTQNFGWKTGKEEPTWKTLAQMNIILECILGKLGVKVWTGHLDQDGDQWQGLVNV